MLEKGRPDFDRRIGQYLRETLGTDVPTVAWPDTARLAPFLTERYRFLRASILGHPILFMIDESPAEEPPANVRKHVAQVTAKADRRIVYVRERVTAYNRKRLIEQRVSFVVPGNQMYLPDLGIDLREHFRRQAATQPRFRPATQAVLIHALLREHDAPRAAMSFTSTLGYSSMTVLRAFDEITAAGLAESTVVGRERILRLSAPRRRIWAQAQARLQDPVKLWRFVQVQPPVLRPLGPKAGLSALAHYTMLAEPANPIVAMTRERWTSLRQERSVSVLPVSEQSAYEVQVWTYVPNVYREPGVVDPLSLYLSLRGFDDERVEQALDRMMETLPW